MLIDQNFNESIRKALLISESESSEHLEREGQQ